MCECLNLLFLQDWLKVLIVEQTECLGAETRMRGRIDVNGSRRAPTIWSIWAGLGSG